MTMTHGDESTLQEIESTFERLGLASQSDRSPFIETTRRPSGVVFDVVISTTSEPFSRT